MNKNNQENNQLEHDSAKQFKKTGNRMILISWCLILLVSFMFFKWFQRSGAYDTTTIKSGDLIEVHIPLTAGDRYEVFGQINKLKVLLLVDTGASIVAVSDELAARAGLTKGQPIGIETAGGKQTAYLTTIDKLVISDDIVLRNVRATINPNMDPKTVLLGMGALKQLDFIHKQNVLILRQR